MSNTDDDGSLNLPAVNCI